MAGYFRFSPCSVCCDTCPAWFQDGFAGADEDPPNATYWTEEVGNWEIAGNALSTADTDARLTLTSAAYDLSTAPIMVVRVKVVSLTGGTTGIEPGAQVHVDGGRVVVEAHHGLNGRQGRLRILTDPTLSGTLTLKASVPLYWTGEAADVLSLVVVVDADVVEASGTGATSATAAVCHATRDGSAIDREVKLGTTNAASGLTEVVFDDFSLEDGVADATYYSGCEQPDRHCIRFFDSFDYDDIAEIDLEWNYDAGDGLTVAHDPDELIVYPTGSYGITMLADFVPAPPCSLTATLLNETTGGVVGLILEWTDADNFIYLWVTQAEIYLTQRVAGTDYTIDSDYWYDPPSRVYVKICHTDELTTIFYGTDASYLGGVVHEYFRYDAAYYGSLSLVIGLYGAIAPGDGTLIGWADIELSDYRDDCPCYDASECIDACAERTAPQFFQVVIDGIVAPSPPPSPPYDYEEENCTEFNGTWLLEQHPTSPCRWTTGNLDWGIDSSCSGYSEILIDLLDSNGSGPYYIGVVCLYGTSFICTWSGNYSFLQNNGDDKFDCMNLIDYDVPPDVSPPYCDLSSATCKVTSL